MSDEPTCKNILDRLARLETRVDLKFDEMEKALVLARDTIRTEKEYARDMVNEKMEHMNQLQRKMDKQELNFATKEEVNANARLIYIGVGIAIAFELVLRFVK